MNKKESKRIERYTKGVANHWRILILDLIAKNPELSVEQITELVRGNRKTISVHLQKLVAAGLVDKKYRGRFVEHTISHYGQRFNRFLLTY